MVNDWDEGVDPTVHEVTDEELGELFKALPDEVKSVALAFLKGCPEEGMVIGFNYATRGTIFSSSPIKSIELLVGTLQLILVRYCFHHSLVGTQLLDTLKYMGIVPPKVGEVMDSDKAEEESDEQKPQ